MSEDQNNNQDKTEQLNNNEQLNNTKQMNKEYGHQGGSYNTNYYSPDNNNDVKSTKKNKKRKNGFRRGLITGITSGVLSSVLIVLLVMGVLQRQGYLHLGTEGKVYVQDVSTSGSSGMGSKVEEKLNAINSLLDSEFYFDDVDEDKAASDIFKAYLNAYGDKYTVYYTPEEYKQLTESTTGKFSGIGAVCEKNEDGSIRLTEIYEDSPAEKAGLKAGDSITKVDGKDIKDMDLTPAVALIKGEKGTTVSLEYVRDGNTATVTVTRDEIEAKTVKYEMKDNNIGYIRVVQFDDVTKNQFMDALNDLKSRGMKSLVVDIRNNPGGMLDTVVSMLDEILPDGLIMYTQDKKGNKT